MSVREVPSESLLPKSPADALEYFLNIQDTFPPTQTFQYEDFLDELMDLEEDDEAKEQLAAQTRYANVIVHVEALGEYEQKYQDNGEEVFPLEPIDCFDSYQDYLDAFRHLGDYQYIYEDGIGHVFWREPDGREAYEEIIPVSAASNSENASAGKADATDADGFVIVKGDLRSYRGNSKKIVIPDNVEYICERAFSGCECIEYVIIPGNVEIVEEKAFANCRNLTDVIFEGDPLVEDLVFLNCDNLTIHAKTGSFAKQHAERNRIQFCEI